MTNWEPVGCKKEVRQTSFTSTWLRFCREFRQNSLCVLAFHIINTALLCYDRCYDLDCDAHLRPEMGKSSSCCVYDDWWGSFGVLLIIRTPAWREKMVGEKRKNNLSDSSLKHALIPSGCSALTLGSPIDFTHLADIPSYYKKDATSS